MDKRRGIMKKCLIVFYLISFLSANAQNKSVTVNYNSSAGTMKNLLGTNVGPYKSPQGYLAAGISEIRTHDFYGPFDYQEYTTFYNRTTKSFNVNFDPDNPAHYSWATSDAKMDSIVMFGITPYFRLGYSYPPQSDPDSYPRYAPLDPNGTTFTKFAKLCKRTVMHYNQGWNNGRTLDIRYWEIMNEPDNTYFWKGSALELYRLYKAVSDTLKNLDPALKIGGPGIVAGTIAAHNKTYYDNFIEYCRNNNLRLDFFSWHLYDRFNPYSIKNYADTVKAVLAKYGYGNSESHITEFNRDLAANSPFIDSPLGAAYAASSLITCQEALVDKLHWYRGVQLGPLCNDDVNGAASLTWNGFAYKMFNALIKETPNVITSTGNEVINFNAEKDTTNFMVLAAKSNDGGQVNILVSHLRSANRQLSIAVQNIPWTAPFKVEVAIYTLQGPDKKYVESKYIANPAATMNISIPNITPPSVFLVKLRKYDPVAVGKDDNPAADNYLYQNYPNPFNPSTKISYSVPVESRLTVKIYNTLGAEIDRLFEGRKSAGKYSVDWNAANLPSGVYFCVADGIPAAGGNAFRSMIKMVYIK